MVLKHLLYGVLLISIANCPALAQPVLPDISGVAGRGLVTLNWQCPYSTIKAISVLRAADTAADYTLLGYVEQTAKGIQSFTDIHPLPGRNCYKLAIEFKTGLIWRSNNSCVKVDPYTSESDKKQLPETKPVPQKAEEKKTEPATKTVASNPLPISLNLKMPLIPDDTIDNSSTHILPHYCTADTHTGYITLTLPADVEKYTYSIKFFDQQNRLVTEVPHIGSARIIFDKRNFQRKKTIRFVLRRDGVELEDGWLSPNPSR